MHGVLRYIDKKLGYTLVEKHGDNSPVYKPVAKNLPFEILSETFNFALWIVSTQATAKTASFIENIADAIAFWFNKFSEQLKMPFEKTIKMPFTIWLQFEEEVFNPLNFQDLSKITGTCKFNSEYKENNLQFIIPREVLKLLVGSDNKGERFFIRELLLSFNKVPEMDLSEQFIELLLDERMPLGSAKMILLMDTQTNLQIDPRWVVPSLYVSDAEINILLDDLVTIVNPDETIPEKITEKQDKKSLCNTIVSSLLNKLKNKTSEFDNDALLKKLIDISESLIYRREYNKIIVPAQIHCFGDMPAKVNQLIEKESKLIVTSLSLRCLIEYVSAIPTQGLKKVGYDDIDEMLAIMDEVLNFGTISDAIHFNLEDPEIGLLPSGRIGTSKSFFDEKLKPFRRATTYANVESYLENFSEAFEIYNPEPNSLEIDKFYDRIDAAFLSDWGIDYTSIHAICGAATRIAVEKGDSVCEMSEGQLIDTMKKFIKISEEQLLIGIQKLSLSKREDFMVAPEGYINDEIYPWKYNREFSYVRRPFIKIESDGVIKFLWGMRNALDASKMLNNLFQSGRLKYGKKEIIQLLGEVNNRKGKQFREHVKNWFNLNTTFKVLDHEITIKPKGNLIAERDYGDIDVLVYDNSANVIFSIECKRTVPARNIHEMKTELDNYIGRDGSTGMVNKHLERDKWLKTNINQVKTFLEVTNSPTVKSLILTDEIIPTYYLKSGNLPLPFINFPELKRNGAASLKLL